MGLIMFIMKLKPEFFELIKSGKKEYEVRLNDEKRQKISVGDRIIFKKEPDLFEGVIVTVEEVKRFNSFYKMAEMLSLKSLGFPDKNIDQVVRVYHKIYSKEDEEKYGVVAFKIKLIQ